MQSKKFQRKIEDFVCGHCGHKIKGTGYTDHCPKCLWSQHVDVNPGDRQADCGGDMEPIGAEIKGDANIIYYKCQRCGLAHRVKAAGEDNIEVIINLSASLTPLKIME
ncbi:RNHCP domain-containing protein [Patescibacteria group bacterium]|nr:RNHCP domain-containing protein [Patescibacteria group bacterium]MBU2220175.1 RNHCP domain-containing protein [Patescibacteria group bacterium]MBU2265295.1 RNHCP domain-containing protein [Patescibacteria group bacterium]